MKTINLILLIAAANIQNIQAGLGWSEPVSSRSTTTVDDGVIETKSAPEPVRSLEDITRAKLLDLIATSPKTDPRTDTQNLLLNVITYVNLNESPTNALSIACVELAPDSLLRSKMLDEQADLAIAHSFSEDYTNRLFKTKITALRGELQQSHQEFVTNPTDQAKINLVWHGLRLATAINYQSINQSDRNPDQITRKTLAEIFHSQGAHANVLALDKSDE
jgi:hypothetical protein